MSIPELLKEAYENEDWEIVAAAYRNLTGKQIGDNDSIFQPKGNNQNEPTQVRRQKHELDIDDDNIGQTKARTEQVQSLDIKNNKYNLWVDDFTDSADVRELSRRSCVAPPAPKGRRQSDIVNVECIDCGKKYNVSMKILNGKKYHCDRCLNKKIPN